MQRDSLRIGMHSPWHVLHSHAKPGTSTEVAGADEEPGRGGEACMRVRMSALTLLCMVLLGMPRLEDARMLATPHLLQLDRPVAALVPPCLQITRMMLAEKPFAPSKLRALTLGVWV